MNYSKILIQTIPAVGALSLSCAPVRGGGDDDDDDSQPGLADAWELRAIRYEGEESSEFPREYEGYYYDCTRTIAYFLVVTSNLSVSLTASYRREGSDCSYYGSSSANRYSGVAEELGVGSIRITIPNWTSLDCPASPPDERMICAVPDSNSEWEFERTDPSNVPPPTTPPDGDDDDDDSAW